MEHNTLSEKQKDRLLKLARKAYEEKEFPIKDVSFLEHWNGFDVYEVVWKGPTVPILGLPCIILVDSKTMRVPTIDEKFDFMNRKHTSD